jgi:predicted ATPase/DNA-binding SARP family transcriptional activator
VEFRILGPLEAIEGGRGVPLRGTKRRSLLALLLLRADRIVSTDTLVEELWGAQVPATARSALRVHIGSLRKAIGEHRLQTRHPGYRICIQADWFDVDCFRFLVRQGRLASDAGQWSETARALGAALSLCRGPALTDFAHEDFAQAAMAELEEERVAALEMRLDADLALGRHREIVGELEALVAAYPFRERFRSQLMLAFYRSGRQGEALTSYIEGRRRLVDELGIEPSIEVQQLQRAILRHEPIPRVPAQRQAAQIEVKTNLPVSPTKLIGRERELAATHDRFLHPDVRLLTLTGPGGTGKTRLALKLAETLSDEFRDGVFVVDLSSLRDPAGLAALVARTLGITESVAGPVTDGLKRWLRDKCLLLLLDNFEHLLGSAALVGELLAAAPQLKVLATSRAPLHISAEHEHPVPPLEVPDAICGQDFHSLSQNEAVDLLVQRARALRPDFAITEANAESVAAISVRLDGLPLAIELAAARTKVLSPEGILARLNRRFELLTGGADDLPSRQRTLRATIDWSYDLLAPRDADLFRGLAVFAGGFTVEAAQAIARATGADAVDGISSLIDKSMLQRSETPGGEPRFRMLETIREYGLERLHDAGQTAAIERRHARFFYSLAQQAELELFGPLQEEWLKRLDAEYDNLQATLDWSVKTLEARGGLKMATALWRFWQVRGYLTQGRTQLERLLSLTDPSDRCVERAAGKCWLASLAFFQGDHDHARLVFHESLATYRYLGDARGTGHATYGLAMVAQVAGDYRSSLALSRESETAFRAAGDDWGKAMTFQGIGQATYCLGSPSVACALFQEGLKRTEALGDRRNIAVFLGLLGTVALQQGDRRAAGRLLEESLAIHRGLGDAWGIPAQLARLGLIAHAGGDHTAARERFTEAVAVRRQTGDRAGLAASLACFAGLALDEGSLRLAARLLGAAGSLRPRSHHPPLFYVEVTPHEEHAAAARAALGDREFEHAWNCGQAMTIDDALTLIAPQARPKEPTGAGGRS